MGVIHAGTDPETRYLGQAVQPPAVVSVLGAAQVEEEHEFWVVGLPGHEGLLEGAAVHHHVGGHRVDDKASSHVFWC